MSDLAILSAARELAQAHHAKYDPSHDFLHVARVTSLAKLIANSLAPAPVDLLVVELAALFHDLLDSKYLPKDAPPPTAEQHLASFFAPFVPSAVSPEQVTLICKIIENVSYSKEVKRIASGGVTDWHRECLELHCVQDADKLDAIGAIGVMRCSAYSAVASRPLYLPPPSSSSPSGPTLPTTEKKGSSCAIEHFHEKLFKLEGMMKTVKGREMAKKRTEFMRAFVEQIESEGREEC